MMNKIQHTISSNKDGEHQTVFDLLEEDLKTPYLQEKLHLVGRLDMDTEGLLIFTTDGELTHKLISPKSNIGKTYFVSLEKEFSEEEKQNVEQLFQEGIAVGPEDNEQGFTCKPAQVSWPNKEVCDSICKNSSYDSSKIKTAALLTITEGKYHQVKRMFKAVNNKVEFLKRIKFGKLELDNLLKPGEYKILTNEEINTIF
jgi:16S rRNA pseudouridine516 synthase